MKVSDMSKLQREQFRKEMQAQAERILAGHGLKGGALKVKASKWVEHAMRHEMAGGK